MSSKIIKYLPEGALEIVIQWFRKYNFHLRICKPRRTKLGDYRPLTKQHPHRISVNGDLNKYHFLITLTHEVAHLITWEKYGRSALPHGVEWKLNYTQLLEEILQKVDFPKDLHAALMQHKSKPKATSCSDSDLLLNLRVYDENQEKTTLDELEEGDHFLLYGKRKFRKGRLRRTRYVCTEMSSGKAYLIHESAEVEKYS